MLSRLAIARTSRKSAASSLGLAFGGFRGFARAGGASGSAGKGSRGARARILGASALAGGGITATFTLPVFHIKEPRKESRGGERAPPEIVEDAVMTYAPDVPPPIKRNHPVTLRVKLDSRVVVAPLTNKDKFTFWTFNGRCPGPFIRARVGDVIEVRAGASPAPCTCERGPNAYRRHAPRRWSTPTTTTLACPTTSTSTR